MSRADVRAKELECESSILEAAQIAGWRRHGERAAMGKTKGYRTPIKGEPGWPDLVLARRGQIVAAELKRDPNTPSEDQLKWLAHLDSRPTVVALVLWVPDQMDQFNARLFERTFSWIPLDLSITWHARLEL